jgi:hypothetical protein
MESDIRAKAPPGPSLVPVPGPFPEIPGGERLVRRVAWDTSSPAPRNLKKGRERWEYVRKM